MLPFFFFFQPEEPSCEWLPANTRTHTDDAKLFTPIAEHNSPFDRKRREGKKGKKRDAFAFKTVTPKFPPLLFLIVYWQPSFTSPPPPLQFVLSVFFFFFFTCRYIFFFEQNKVTIARESRG